MLDSLDMIFCIDIEVMAVCITAKIIGCKQKLNIVIDLDKVKRLCRHFSSIF